MTTISDQQLVRAAQASVYSSTTVLNEAQETLERGEALAPELRAQLDEAIAADASSALEADYVVAAEGLQAITAATPSRPPVVETPTARAIRTAIFSAPQLAAYRGQTFALYTAPGKVAPLPHRSARFAYALPNPEAIDPGHSNDTSGIIVMTQLFEGPLNPSHPAAREAYTLGAADAMAVSSDKTLYVFHLRPEAKWSNGRPVTADDFVYSYRRFFLDKRLETVAPLFVLKNGERCYNDELPLDRLGVYQLGPDVVALELASPDPEFPIRLTGEASWLPVSREAIEAHHNQWTWPEHIICNGAYCLASQDPEKMVLARQDATYWDQAQVMVASVTHYIQESETVAFQWYELDKNDWVERVPLEQIPHLQRADRPDFHVYPGVCSYVYIFNVTHPHWRDPNMRHAVLNSIDRSRLARSVFNNSAKPAFGFVPPAFAEQGYISPANPRAYANDAETLLTAQGYSAANPLAIEIKYNTADMHRTVAEFVQRSMKEKLGGRAEIQITNMEWKSYMQAVNAKEFELGRMGLCPDYASPLAILEMFHSQHHENRGGYANATYDALIGKIRQTADIAERHRLYAEAERILMQDLPWLPVVFYNFGQLLKPDIQGFRYDKVRRPLIKYIRRD